MSIRPLIKTPFSDVFGMAENCQLHPVCASFELRMANCLDAYGVDRGLNKCHFLIHDYYECITQDKRIARYMMMNRQRARHYGQTRKEYEWLPLPAPDLL